MADWLNVIITFIYTVATIFICFFNYKSTKATKEQTIEIKRQFDEENRAYITVEVVFVNRAFYMLKFTNNGRKIAKNVKIVFDDNFINSLMENDIIRILKELKTMECIIGIGQTYEVPIGTTKIRRNARKEPASGVVYYKDINDDIKEQNFHINLMNYAHFHTIETFEEKFLKEIKLQRTEIAKLADKQNGFKLQ